MNTQTVAWNIAEHNARETRREPATPTLAQRLEWLGERFADAARLRDARLFQVAWDEAKELRSGE